VRRCRLPDAAVRTIIEHARLEQPRECCGLLIGRGDEIVEAVPVPNLAAEPGRFLVDPESHIRTRRDMRGRGLSVVGFYHSHPSSPAAPSARDVAEAADDDALYLIVSLEGDEPVVRVFTMARGGFAEVPIAGSA
jgi:proteasome lid subunit RPN8/RPN11